jgi:hypothetical protein
VKHPTNRRTVLMTASAAVVAAAAGSAAAQSTEIRGSVTFEGGAAIPKGHLKIFLDGPDGAEQHVTATRIESDGGQKFMAFALPVYASATSSRVVARLERADGWLVARGSARLAGSPVDITLTTVMY